MASKHVSGKHRCIHRIAVFNGPDGVLGCVRELEANIRRFPPRHWYIVSSHNEHVHVVHICQYTNGSCRCRWISKGNSLEEMADADLFQLSDLTPAIGEPSCVTYLTTRGSSKKLVASQKMKDYIIDLNIYRLILINRILYMCEKTLKIQTRNINYIKQLSRHSNPPLKRYWLVNSPLHNIFMTYNALDWYPAFLSAENTMRLYMRNIFECMRELENNYSHWNIYTQQPHCNVCTFHHHPFNGSRRKFNNFVRSHPLLNTETIDHVYNLCCK